MIVTVAPHAKLRRGDFKKYTSTTSCAHANVYHFRSNGSITLRQYHLYVFHNSLEGFVPSPAGSSIQSNTNPQLQIFWNHAAHFTGNSLTPAMFNFPPNQQFTHTSTTHLFTSPCYLEWAAVRLCLGLWETVFLFTDEHQVGGQFYYWRSTGNRSQQGKSLAANLRQE